MKQFEFYADGIPFGTRTMTLEQAQKYAQELQLTFKEIT